MSNQKKSNQKISNQKMSIQKKNSQIQSTNSTPKRYNITNEKPVDDSSSLRRQNDGIFYDTPSRVKSIFLCMQSSSSIFYNLVRKKLKSLIVTLVIIISLYRLCPSDLMTNFLIWIEKNPRLGIIAYVLVYALHVVLLLPGTPLTMGGGYVFKVTYGWVNGILLGSILSLLGSLWGGVTCFLLSRYCMRDKVRTFTKRSKYASQFDAIDKAISVQGFKIIALLYLTPILPFGPFSYMAGTTSIDLIHFASAKIFSLPLTALYVVMGASTGALVTTTGKNDQINNLSTDDNATHLMVGIIASVVSLSIISVKMKKELQKVSRTKYH